MLLRCRAGGFSLLYLYTSTVLYPVRYDLNKTCSMTQIAMHELANYSANQEVAELERYCQLSPARLRSGETQVFPIGKQSLRLFPLPSRLAKKVGVSGLIDRGGH